MRPELIGLAAKLSGASEAFARVTVVRREAPSSARVGDTALVTATGAVHGWVGGGCTRSTLVREALRAMLDGEPRLLCLSSHPARHQRPGVIVEAMTCKSGGTVELYFEPVLPSPCLVVVGATPAALALVRLGAAVGYSSVVVDPAHHMADESLDLPAGARVIEALGADAVPRGAYALVARMDESDLEAIEALGELEPAYVGLIASRKRFVDLRATLQARGVPQAFLDRIAAPAGLDIGARTPEEIALSVLAQIVAVRRKPAQATSADEPTSTVAGPANAPMKAPMTEQVARREAKPKAEMVAVSVSRAAKLEEATDPVCGMTVALAGARHYADVGGRRAYFCCGGCRQAFLADPARYAAAPDRGPGA